MRPSAPEANRLLAATPRTPCWQDGGRRTPPRVVWSLPCGARRPCPEQGLTAEGADGSEPCVRNRSRPHRLLAASGLDPHLLGPDLGEHGHPHRRRYGSAAGDQAPAGLRQADAERHGLAGPGGERRGTDALRRAREVGVRGGQRLPARRGGGCPAAEEFGASRAGGRARRECEANGYGALAVEPQRCGRDDPEGLEWWWRRRRRAEAAGAAGAAEAAEAEAEAPMWW